MEVTNIELDLFEIGEEPEMVKIPQGFIALLMTNDTSVAMRMGAREMPMPSHSVYLFYDQNRSYQLPFLSKENGFLIVIKLSVDTLHHILGQGTDETEYSNRSIFEKEQYHKFDKSSPTIKRCIHEIVQNKNNLLLKEAKKFAILNDYFNTEADQDKYKCPFLNQKDNVEKVREAKNILIKDLQNSPTIKTLAKSVALNEYNLKTGFKEIYGCTIYSYLKDYKMAKARELIMKKEYQVAEIADELGYSNVSHFIDAFKKKYAITPKKFELSLR